MAPVPRFRAAQGRPVSDDPMALRNIKAISRMKKRTLYRVSSLMLVLVLAGCKVMDDKVDDEVTQESSAGSNENSPPVIWGAPGRSVLVHGHYLFVPEASDTDGDVLEYEIANKPEWAAFDALTGTLQGTPQAEHMGRWAGVVISVTDGNSVSSLPPFAVTVHDPSEPLEEESPGGASPPVIEGNPNKSVVVNTLYSFKPEASDPDGDELSFSVVNRPSWARFETTTGLLEGEPNAGDIGTTRPIQISVTDGVNIAALSEFTITVDAVGSASLTITWNAPTENEDGSPLTDLAGYRIYYGSTSGKYGKPVDVQAGVTSYVIDDIGVGTWYLAMTSVNSGGRESEKTAEISFEIGG